MTEEKKRLDAKYYVKELGLTTEKKHVRKITCSYRSHAKVV